MEPRTRIATLFGAEAVGNTFASERAVEILVEAARAMMPEILDVLFGNDPGPVITHSLGFTEIRAGVSP